MGVGADVAEVVELRTHTVELVTTEVLEKLAAHFETQPEAAGKSLQILQAKHVTFVTDRVLLTQVMSHLVCNALEACTQGQTVTLTANQEGDNVTLGVHNPGAIPREASRDAAHHDAN